MVRALGLHAVTPGSNCSNIPGSNSTTLCKQSTGCLLPVGVLNPVAVKFIVSFRLLNEECL